MSTAASYDVLYLSPHLDDAVLSCGGQIRRWVRSGVKVLVITPMAGDAPAELSPLAQDLHRLWGLEDVMAARRLEDVAACRSLGADVLHWDLLDALYRRHPATAEPFYPSLGSLFGGLAEADREPLEEAAHRLERWIQIPRVFAPLGVGRHVDHLLIRRAAEHVFGEARLEYYEDYPYARKRWVLLKTLRWPWRFRSEVFALDEEMLVAKCRAVACYASQLLTAFRDLEDMEQEVRRFARRVGGERVWRWRRPRHPLPAFRRTG